MIKHPLISFLLYTFLACLFAFSSFLMIFIIFFGLAIPGWNPFRWLFPMVFPDIFIIVPGIYFLSCSVAFYTFQVLSSRNITNSKKEAVAAVVIGCVLGIIGVYWLILGGNVISMRGGWTEDNTVLLPIWGCYFSILLLLTLFGLYIAWHDPNPKDDDELNSWREYDDKIELLTPCAECFVIYWFLFFFGIIFLFIFLLFINLVAPNPFTSYYLEPENSISTLSAIVLFPGLFLHVISFIIYFRRAIFIKLDLFLLHCRSIGENGQITLNHRKQASVEADEVLEQKSMEELQQRTAWQNLLSILGIGIALPSPLFVLLLLSYFPLLAFREEVLIFIFILTMWLWLFYVVILICVKFGGEVS